MRVPGGDRMKNSIRMAWPGPPADVVKGRRRTWLWLPGFVRSLSVSTALVLGLIGDLESEQATIMDSVSVERELQRILQLSRDIEIYSHLNVMGGEPVFLEPAVHVPPEFNSANARLRKLAQRRPGLAGSFAQLEAELERRLDHAPLLHAKAAPEESLDIDRILAATDRQAQIRSIVARVDAQERATRERAMEQSMRVSAMLRAAVVLSTLAVATLGCMWWSARRRVSRIQDNHLRMFASAANGIAVVGAEGRIVQVNPAYAAMLSYKQDQLVGTDFILLMHSEERKHASEALHAIFDAGAGSVRSERRHLRSDGSVVWVRTDMSRVCDVIDGSPLVLVMAEDISERIRNEELLRRASVLLRNSSRMAAIDGWFLALPEGPLQLGDQLRRLLGIDDDCPRAVLNCLDAASQRALLRAVNRCRRDATAFDLDLQARIGADVLLFRIMGQPVQGAYGLRGIDGAAQNITEQRRSQRSLRKSERRFRAAAQVTNDGVWDWDVAAGTIWRSPSIAHVVGLDAQSLGDTPEAWQSLIHPDDRGAVSAGLTPVLQGMADEYRAEYRVRKSDGTHAYVLDKACALRDDSGAVVRLVGGVRDLTERRRSQQALMGMAACVPNGDSGAFFHTLLTHLLEAVGADGGAIARPDPAYPPHMRTVAALVDGVALERFEYDLASSPCARLDLDGEYLVPDNLGLACPEARGLPGLRARGYAGRRLLAADGRPLGVIFAVFRCPIAAPDSLIPVLRVFAARAGAELERLDDAARVREQAALLDQAREAIVVLDLGLNIKFWNRGAEAMYGTESASAVGQSVLPCYQKAQVARDALRAVLDSGEWRGESVHRRSDGPDLVIDESWTLVRDEHGAPHSVLKVGSDVTEKRAAQEQIRRLAYYDSLTGLPNRRLLMERLRQLVLHNERRRCHAAMLFIDMDNFKALNDVHGHDAGDSFLCQAAGRLRACVRAGDTVARLGGDEFVILLDSLDAEPRAALRQARAVGTSIVNAFHQPVEIGTIEHRSTASVGIVLIDAGQHEVEELLRRADQAMYRAKKAGRNGVAADDADDGTPGANADALLRALENGELELWLQPEADAGAAPSGAAACVRWHRGDGDYAEGAEFISLADRCGVMPVFAAWALDRCGRILSHWQRDPGRARCRLVLALTQHPVRDPDFGRRVLDSLTAHGCRPEGLVLELPQAAFDAEAPAGTLGMLRAAGVRVMIADFGMDAMSLSRLRRIGADGLRLDRDLVRSCTTVPVDAAVVRAITGLAMELGMFVVADGVEEAAQREILVAAGCSYLRGPLVGPAAVVTEQGPDPSHVGSSLR